MDEQDEEHGLADRFETHRGRLRAVAYRMLGSATEADDAVQETWLRLGRTDVEDIVNLPGWLTTVVSRICLDMLRTRASRREDFLSDEGALDRVPSRTTPTPEEEAVLVESVGRALLVVLDTLGPAERVAFVLHDTFAVPFDRIAPVVDRSTAATKKLASRARQKVRGTPALPDAELARHRHVVEAFLNAARGGDLTALLAVLAPDVVRRAEAAALSARMRPEIRGADAVARETVVLARNARFAAPALVNGRPGLVVAPHGRLRLALTVTIESGRVTAYEVIATPSRLHALDLALLPD
ncbi:sigma-70 family RNA polymerase sigma factor [Streptomyces sp. AN091965]|uniref:sigma-70 family RNA polymerase sigma factor n=1 Tax=Streptomyces sp. AN091965 TaxID=2927803 RepID=UPI001F617A52|nr:sigma-70 family RNA polymerase sigma factor [Streptomyces sp. AN091965]MCI3931248.1 sigma-70 family RNA polymerase sigma factor [Streptomyces sp. AN091965]